MPQKISPYWESQTSYPHRRRSTRMQRFGPIRPRSLYRRNLRFAHYFYKQLRDQGLLLVVIKTEAGGYHLFLLRKTVDHFESLWSAPCGFVQLRGSYQFEDLEPNTLDKAIPTWSELQNREITKRRFWWDARGEPTQTWSTVGIRSFLAIIEPAFRPFKTTELEDLTEHDYFGLWDAVNGSLTVAKDDWLITYRHASGRKIVAEASPLD
jgi:hypothetical protein